MRVRGVQHGGYGSGSSVSGNEQEQAQTCTTRPRLPRSTNETAITTIESTYAALAASHDVLGCLLHAVRHWATLRCTPSASR